jgi:ornithine cyclodeaminase/alanine dehydrogenase-like protein (mu-crystallin family)
MESMVPEGCCITATMRFQDLDPMLSKKADKWVLGTKSSDGTLILDYYNSKKWDKIAIELSQDDVYADMGDIVTGKKLGRENDKERILYTHMGMGAHDLVLAQTAYQKAMEKGVGTKVKLI